jgi:hypothetical protein
MTRTLFDWSDERQAQAEPTPTSAEIVVFPTTRNAMVEKLAQRFIRYDEKRAAFFLRQEVVKVVRKHLNRGVPDRLAARDGSALERAVWARMWTLWRQERGA